MKYIEIRTVLLLILVVFFVALYSATTSPLYDNNIYNSDSTIFKIIGQGWYHGILPYRDLWDSKGPFIFFVNALGFALTKSNMGIFLIQIFNLYIVVLLAYYLFNRTYGRNSSFALSILFLGGISWNYECGNNVEEYTLIPLTLACIFFYKWLVSHQKDFRYSYTLLLGLTLGICLMSRLTNALYVCFMAIVVAIKLFCQREYKKLSFHVLIFTVGVTAVVVPFLVYFYAHGVLKDMWYATFTYNLGYFHSSTVHTYLNKAFYILQYLYCGILLCASLFYRPIQKSVSAYWSIIAILTFGYFYFTFGYGHYGLISYPFLVIVVMLVGRYPASYRKFSLLLLTCFVVFSMCIRYHAVHLFHNTAKEEYQSVVQQIPQKDKNDVVLYNCYSNGYLIFDLKSPSPFFVLQDWAITCNPTLKDKVLASIQKTTPKWIVIEESATESAICTILKNKYVKVAHNHVVSLYKYNVN